MELRDYQVSMKKAIYSAWRERKKCVMMQMPTGTGKTVVAASIIEDTQTRNRKVLYVVHRRELIEQADKKLQEIGISSSRILSGERFDAEENVQIASIQTLSRRKNYPEADIVIIDEAHHCVANSYEQLWEIYPQALFLGMTATPTRLNGEGFDHLFDQLICAPSIEWFTSNKYLVPIEHYIASQPDLSRIKVQHGDYKINDLSQLMSSESIMPHLVENYLRYAAGKKGIVFAVDVEHSKRITQQYKDAGISACHIDWKTPKKEREEILQAFSDGEIKLLINADLVSEGYDVPDCEVIQAARPTKSRAKYYQQGGRGMRPCEGKDKLIFLDHANLWKIHGLIGAPCEWTLSPREKKQQYVDNPLGYIDREGEIHPVRNAKQQLLGFSLVLLTTSVVYDELERCIKKAQYMNHKPLRGYFLFIKWCKKMGIPIDNTLLTYCEARFKGHAKSYFWQKQREELLAPKAHLITVTGYTRSSFFQ